MCDMMLYIWQGKQLWRHFQFSINSL